MLVNFHDVILPDFITIYLCGGPVFNTNCAATISGQELRISHLQNATQKYQLLGCKLSSEQFALFN